MAQKKTKKVSTKTKAELIEENETLKSKIKELMYKDKSLDSQDENLDKLGFTITRDGDGSYILSKIYMDGKKYKIEEFYRHTGNHMALYYAKKFLVEELLERAEKNEQ